MPTDDAKIYLLEEFKALRHEIDENQRDSFRIIQFGFTLTGILLTVAFTEFLQPEIRWIFLFMPYVILHPLTLLTAQRVRATHRIGGYIADKVEPKLETGWETYSRERRRKEIGKSAGKERKIPLFVWGTALPFIFLQGACPVLSFILLLFSYSSFSVRFFTSLTLWVILTTVVCYSIIKIQKPRLDEANRIIDAEDSQ